MPRLEELEICSNDADTTSPGTIDETSKSRLMQIFDSACDDGITPTAAPSPRLRSSLKPHQLTALTMMSEREHGVVEMPQFPSVWKKFTLSDGTMTYRHCITGRVDSHPSLARGGILADEMGLGKTLTLLSLICWSIDMLSKDKATKDNGQSFSTLIITPKSTINEWKEQIERHIFPDQIRAITYHGSNRRGVAQSFQNNDIVLTTYETMRSEFENKGPLYAENWFRVVLDEAHHIGNRSTMTFRAACGTQAIRRWCLTGTPIHNSLDNYGALLSFIGVAPFIEKSQFDVWIANPIKEKRPNSWEKLRSLVRGTSLRRTKQVMDQSLQLPPRKEKIECVDLYQSERELYEFFRQKTAAVAAGFWQKASSDHPPAQRKDKNILSLINLLRLVCNHGNLLSTSALSAWKAKQSAAVNWRLMRSSTKTCAICKAGLEEFSGQGFEPTMPCGHSVCAMCSLERQDGDADMSDPCTQCSGGNTPGNPGTSPRSFGSDISSSSKIDTLLRNIRLEQAYNQKGTMGPPTKSVIFSYWTRMLDLIQKALDSNGFYSQRLDGQMSIPSRSNAIRQFTENPRCTVLLATINCAGEGIDLTAANSVHLVEPHWNPMVEAQAIARVHRIGQSRPVMATKYVTRNSIEEYVRWIQEDKLRLIARSLNVDDDICQKELENERWKKLKAFLG
ncbi:hypothetical protein LX36DRAFT_483339 [Colletotrichum falcatum]|nr:hypothetical protein LX36DRAFT_483339 [Colletotrichum falcatum]